MIHGCTAFPSIQRRCGGSRRAVVLLTAWLLASWNPGPAVAAEPNDVLADLRREHPRLLLTADQQQQIATLAESDEVLAGLIEQNRARAIHMLGEPKVRYEIPDGKRLLAQSRYAIERILAMALAYRLSQEPRLAAAAIDEMLTAAQFKDWNPSHFLDTAEMMTALAVGYDWLYDEIAPQDRVTIRTAIKELGLREGLKVYARGNWWATGENNWNQVCNGGMVLGALAIAEDEPELAREVIAAALESIPHGVRVYRPNGVYPEGPVYWDYGTMYTCLTISGLQTAVGTDFGILDTPGLEQTGDFRIQTLGPTGLAFNFADGGSNLRPTPAMFLLASAYDQPAYAAWHRQRLAAELQDQSPAESQGRFFPLEIAWYPSSGQPPAELRLPLDALFRGQQDIVTMRSDWAADAVYVGFKGGDNRTNHGHLDIGSFVMDADGVRWAVDLGPDNYNLPGYFGSQRWTYYRMTNHSHNTLVIDDQLQDPAAACPVTAFHATPQRAGAIVDMTDAYQGQAESVVRGIELLGDRRTVHVRDEIQGAAGSVQWRMVTAAEIELIDGTTARLTQEGRSLTVKVVTPSDARFEVLSTRPPTREENQNAGTRILAATLPAGDGALSVLLQAGSDAPAAIADALKPLAQWPR